MEAIETLFADPVLDGDPDKLLAAMQTIRASHSANKLVLADDLLCQQLRFLGFDAAVRCYEKIYEDAYNPNSTVMD